MKNGIFTFLTGFLIAILIITVSIGLPIYVRPFYYYQVDALNIEAYSGADRETIIEAYDELMDYLTIPGNEFKTGKFKYSESGKAHFVDCKVLFDLNLYALITAVLGLAILFILNISGCFKLCRPFGKHVMFSSGLFTLTGFAVIGGLAATDFDRAFTIFHQLFFPGKSNWLFSWYEDEIIRILPQDFFMNCAILILVSIITLCILAIILGGVSKKKINC